jgi:hypothetical protein
MDRKGETSSDEFITPDTLEARDVIWLTTSYAGSHKQPYLLLEESIRSCFCNILSCTSRLSSLCSIEFTLQISFGIDSNCSAMLPGCHFECSLHTTFASNSACISLSQARYDFSVLSMSSLSFVQNSLQNSVGYGCESNVLSDQRCDGSLVISDIVKLVDRWIGYR